MKKHVLRITLGLLIIAGFLLHATGYFDEDGNGTVVSRLEALAYDARLQLTMPRTVDPRIAIVDIDERSLAAEGRWPWRRDRLAFMLDRLFDDYKVRLVGFDVVFAERDESSGLHVLRSLSRNELRAVPGFHSALEKVAPQLEYDRIFAEKIRGRRVVLGYYFNLDPEETAAKVNQLPPPALPKGVLDGRNIHPTRWTGYGANLPELQQAAAAVGHFNSWPDPDGVTRRVPMLAERHGALYEPLSLAVVRVLQGMPEVKAGITSAAAPAGNYPGLEWLDVGDLRIPVDRDVTVLVPYRGPQYSFPYVSATDVLTGKAARAELEGKIVLVGSTAPGLNDLRSAPVAKVFPGVEIQANLVSGILEGRLKQVPPYVLGVEFVLLAVVGLTMVLVLPLLNPQQATLVTLGLLLAIVGTNLVAWQYGDLVLPLASGLLMAVLLFGLNMSYGFFVESRAKKQIAARFGQYVPPELVDEMSRHPERFSMKGESREMSVLFSDVRGFTTISEGLDPEVLSELMNQFLTPLTQVIYRRRGTIDKYMGDCIMAFWGAPVADGQHQRNAVLAGLEMLATMDALQPQLRARGWPALHIGVGVCSGRMSVGNMGSEIRVAYTVMGDAVNLASRFEGLTKQYGVGMIVGEATRAACNDIVFRELDRVRAKGRTEPVGIYEPIGLASELGKDRLDEISLWNEVLKRYRAQEWDMAEIQLIELQRMCPRAALYPRFLARLAHYRNNRPGPDWDGTWAAESK